MSDNVIQHLSEWMSVNGGMRYHFSALQASYVRLRITKEEDVLTHISETDIELFIKAKQQRKRAKTISIFAIITLLVYVVLRLLDVHLPFMSEIVLGTLGGALLANSDLIGSSSISKSNLIDALGRQIDQNPEAIKYLVWKISNE